MLRRRLHERGHRGERPVLAVPAALRVRYAVERGFEGCGIALGEEKGEDVGRAWVGVAPERPGRGCTGRDGLERQLAAINAALSTLERQMQDSAES